MSNHGQNSLEKLTYRQIQKITKKMELPSNYKKQQLIDIIYAKIKGPDSEVARLITIAKNKRRIVCKQRKRHRIQAMEISSTMDSNTSPTHGPSMVIDQQPKTALRYLRRDRIPTVPLPIRKTRRKNCSDPNNPLLHDTGSSNDFVQERIQFPIYNKFGGNLKRSRWNIDNEPSSTVDCITRRKPVLRNLLQPSSKGNDCSMVMTRYLNMAKHENSKLKISTQLKAGLSTSMNQEIPEVPIDYTTNTSSEDLVKYNCDTDTLLQNSSFNKKAFYENKNMFEKTYIRYRSYKQDIDKFIFLYRRKLGGPSSSPIENNDVKNMDSNHQNRASNMSVNNMSSNSVHESNNIILENNIDSNIPTDGIYRDDIYMLQMDNFVNSISNDQTRHVLEVQRNEPDYLIQELGEERNYTTPNPINNSDIANLCKDVDIDNNVLLMADETLKDFTEDNLKVYNHKKMKAKMLLKEQSQNFNNSEDESAVYSSTASNTSPLPQITQAFSQYVPQNYYENGIENIDNNWPLNIGKVVETYDDNCKEPVYNFKDTIEYPVVPTQQDFPETVMNYKQECISPPLAHQDIEPISNIYSYDEPVSFDDLVPHMEYPDNLPQSSDQDEIQNRFMGKNNQISYPLIYEYLQSSEKEILLKKGVFTDNNCSYDTSLADLASQIEDIEESDISNNNAHDLDLFQYSDTNLGASVTVPDLDENALSFMCEETYSDTNLGASVTVPDLDENALSFMCEETAYPSDSLNQDFSSMPKETEDDGGHQCCFCEWNGDTSTLEAHIRQVHQSEISEVYTTEFEQELSLGTLINWPSSVLTTVLEYKSQLLLLRVKYENPDFILGSLSMIPSRLQVETPFNMVSMSVFNKVTGEPFSWRGEMSRLHSNQAFQATDNFLCIKISQLDLLPNSANIVLLNGKLVPLSPSKAVVCGQIHLNDIIIKIHFSLFKHS